MSKTNSGNLRILSAGELDLAFTRSDWQRAALDGTDLFDGERAIPELQGFASLYPETFTLLVREGADVTAAPDLVGKSVDIGHPASGRNASLNRLIGLLSADTHVYSRVDELHPANAVDDLCAGRLDATILITGHPNALVARALRDCNARLVDFTGPLVDDLLASDPSFSKSMIPIRTYPRMTSDVMSWAVTATIVTREDADARTVERFVSLLLSDLDRLAAENPLFRGLTPETMRGRGMTAPLHPGALRAFEAFGPATP